MTTKPMKPASTRIARLVVRTLARIISGAPSDLGLDSVLGSGMHDLALAHHTSTGDDLILEVELQRAVLADEQLEQGEHVAREQLRGMLGHRGGQVQGRD